MRIIRRRGSLTPTSTPVIHPPLPGSVATTGKPDVLLIGTRSEVSLCLNAQEALKKKGMEARVISMPSWKLFEDQDEAYRDSATYHPRWSSQKRPANRGRLRLPFHARQAPCGRTVAELLGLRLTAAEKTLAPSPWVVFDANLAKQVLEDHMLPANLEWFMTEDAQLLPVEAIVEEVLGLHPAGWRLVQHTTQTILRLAGLGHTILVGRGGNVITHASLNVFHVRLVAPLATRIRRAAEYYPE